MLFVRVGILRRRIHTCLHMYRLNIHNGTIYTRIIGILYYAMAYEFLYMTICPYIYNVLMCIICNIIYNITVGW